MFDKDKFKSLLGCAIGNSTMTEFAEKSGVNRTYLSKYMNKRLDSPPSPHILRQIFDASDNVKYYDLMESAGYIDANYFNSRKNSVAGIKLLDEDFINSLCIVKKEPYKVIEKQIMDILSSDEIDFFDLDIDGYEILDNIKEQMLSNSNAVSVNVLEAYLKMIIDEFDHNKRLIDVIPQLNKLNEILEKDPEITLVLTNDEKVVLDSILSLSSHQFKKTDDTKATSIPLLGTIAAGAPILAEENIEDYFHIDSKIKADFALRIKGESMINVGIDEGDIVFIKKQCTLESGEIGAILIDGEATLKKFYMDNGTIILQSENKAYKPMIFTDCDMKILGRLAAVLSVKE